MPLRNIDACGPSARINAPHDASARILESGADAHRQPHSRDPARHRDSSTERHDSHVVPTPPFAAHHSPTAAHADHRRPQPPISPVGTGNRRCTRATAPVDEIGSPRSVALADSATGTARLPSSHLAIASRGVCRRPWMSSLRWEESRSLQPLPSPPLRLRRKGGSRAASFGRRGTGEARCPRTTRSHGSEHRTQSARAGITPSLSPQAKGRAGEGSRSADHSLQPRTPCVCRKMPRRDVGLFSNRRVRPGVC